MHWLMSLDSRIQMWVLALVLMREMGCALDGQPSGKSGGFSADMQSRAVARRNRSDFAREERRGQVSLQPISANQGKSEVTNFREIKISRDETPGQRERCFPTELQDQ